MISWFHYGVLIAGMKFLMSFYYFMITGVTIIIVYIHEDVYIFTVKPILHHNRNRLKITPEI